MTVQTDTRALIIKIRQ